MKSLRKLLVTASVAALAATQAFAYTNGYSIGLNFGADEVNGDNTGTLAPADQAGIPAYAQKNWNNYTGPNSDSPQPASADNKGAAVSVTTTVEWASNGTWANAVGTTNDRGEHNNSLTGTDFNLMIGYLDTGAPTTTTVTIHSVPTDLINSGYNVVVYMLGGVSGRGGGYRITDLNDNEIKPWKLGDASSNPSTYIEDPGLDHTDTGDYMVFQGLTASDIKVVATTDFGLGFGSTQRAPLNAVQLVPYPGQKAPLFNAPVGNPVGFTMDIEDFNPIIVDQTTVTATLDGSAIQPTVTKPAAVTTLSYDSFAAKQQFLAAGSQHTVVVNLKDTTGKAWGSTNTFTVPNYPTLDPATKLATAATTPGMSATTFQLPQDNPGYNRTQAWARNAGSDDPNQIRKAEEELVGGFFDFQTGQPFPNVVQSTANNNIDDVNWDYLAQDVAGEFFGSATMPADTAIPNDPVPGVDPNSGYTDYIVTEVVTYLRIPAAGLYRMGVASDDGFLVTAGQPGPLGLLLGDYDTGRGVAESTFDFAVTEAGDYPFRLLWWQGTGGANCEWYMVDRTTGNRYLINGPQNNPLALKAFRSGQPRAYVKSVSPANDYYFADADKPLVVTLADGATQVTTSSVKLMLNGADVTSAATVQKSGSTTTVTYNKLGYATVYNGQIIWTETGGPAATLTNSFRFATGGPFPYSFPQQSFWIEAEDFDHDSGQHETTADFMPYIGGAYDGLGATGLVDYNNDDSTTDTGVLYRYLNGDSSQGLNPYVDFYSNTGNILTTERPFDTTMSVNYAIGWSGATDWYDYTRAIPQGVYVAYGALSYDDGENSAFDYPTRISATLGKVTAGVGTSSQTIQPVGSFVGPSTGGWGCNSLAPLKDAAGNPAYLKVNSATTTLQVNVSNGDYDYFILKPVTVPAKLTGVQPDLGFAISPGTSVIWTYADFSTTVNTSSVQLTANGTAVPSAQLAAVKNGDITTITFNSANLAFGNYNYVLTVKDSAGADVGTSGTFVIGTPPPLVLLVVGTASVPTLNASDAGVKARLEGMGFQVKVIDAPSSQTSDATGKALIVNSSTVNSGDVANKFQTVPVPVINWEQALEDNYLFTLDTATTHNSTTSTTETQLNIVNANHPLAAGLPTGPLTVSSGTQFCWGVPAATATIIATTVDDPTQAAIYGFEKGALLVDGTTAAAARRVQFPGSDDSFATLNANGLKLFDAAVAWATGQQTTTAPKFGPVQIQGGNVTITWVGGGALQSSTDLKTWTDVSGNPNGTYTTAATAAHSFYRVR
jgi:hypothetical protein